MRNALASILLLAGTLAGAQPREGEPLHIPVVLLEFSDVHFTLENPAGHFTERLNGSRSVREYYVDNSGGRFEPVFDIYGPVTLDKKMAWYGKDIFSGGARIDDMRPEQALLDACGMLDGEVDFSVYDKDADGIIDLCIFYFAGYDQAQGGPADALWAHHWNIQDSEQEALRDISFDEVRPGAYFCGSELSGGSGSKPSGIGPTCHELGHTLELPDFYDVNGAADGFAGGLYDFSLMCRGLYNNDGHTPPHLNALERFLLGWLEDIPELPEGEVVLEAVQKGQAYRISTETEGEFFLLEARDGTSWDHPLPEGLVVYHVDQSERLVGEFPARELWTGWRAHNILNNSGTHPCFYLIPSADPTSLHYPSAFNASALVFPGSVKRLFYDPVDWEGNFTDTQLTTIEFQDGKASFRVLKGKGAHIDGVVRNSAGKPVADARVAVEGHSPEVLTDSRGFFLLPIDKAGDYSLQISKNGYLPLTVSARVPEGTRMLCLSLELNTPGEASHSTLQKFEPSLEAGSFPEESAFGAVRFMADELKNHGGERLQELTCYPYISSKEQEIGDMYVIVDFGPLRVLSKKVDNPVLGEFRPVVVDLTEENIRIPEGIDVYVGYGFEKAPGNTPLGIVKPGTEGNSYWSGFSLERSDWKELSWDGGYMDLMLSAEIAEVPGPSLEQLGYVYIDPGQGSYQSGDLFTPQLRSPEYIKIKAVQWEWDGKELKTASFRLNKGDHQLVARIEYEDGRKEKLGTRVKVN